MQTRPQWDVILHPGNEVRFISLSRTAKVKPEYLPRAKERYHSQEAANFAIDHYRATGKILLHAEVKRILARQREERVTKTRKPEIRRTLCAPQQEEFRL